MRIGKKRIHIKPSMVFLYVLMLALVLFTALPLVYMVSTAFKPLDEIFMFPPRFFVRRPTGQNFYDLLISLGTTSVPFLRFIFNSLVITVFTVLCTVLVSSMAAYGIVKHHPPGSKAFFAVIVAALMFSTHVTQIPRYMVVNSLGLIDTYWALILPNIAVAYNMFLMKQFTEQFPDALLEAARIDGAGECRIFTRIVMPALSPAWATLVVFSFVSSWNDYFSPLIFTTSQAMKTLPLALQTIGGTNLSRAGAAGAAAFLMIVPTIILFTAMQSKVMETMVHSGIK